MKTKIAHALNLRWVIAESPEKWFDVSMTFAKHGLRVNFSMSEVSIFRFCFAFSLFRKWFDSFQREVHHRLVNRSMWMATKCGKITSKSLTCQRHKWRKTQHLCQYRNVCRRLRKKLISMRKSSFALQCKMTWERFAAWKSHAKM